ncbi:CHC2 zinc finger domain-containing protein [Chitinilyticum aquatile]|uniref:CHC2 zinc finger domain-containing protein n=1 Tax=Chitinilyticum aquatile TaxID=362520 RepID=UPI00040EBE35|nr:CHC2 zinc finger domain-containing protein [Chitinilyticum aquatile]
MTEEQKSPVAAGADAARLATRQPSHSSKFNARIAQALAAFAAKPLAASHQEPQGFRGDGFRQGCSKTLRFDRSLLPSPAIYYVEQLAMRLHGRGLWRDALCPFHKDSSPSLRVNLETGAFRCMACGVHGGDVLAFEMQRTGCDFPTAAKCLNAWRA